MFGQRPVTLGRSLETTPYDTLRPVIDYAQHKTMSSNRLRATQDYAQRFL